MIVGYCRVSTKEQNPQAQLEILQRNGCEKIFEEKDNGQNLHRPILKQAMDFVREGDTFVVTRLDRFARSSLHLFQFLEALEKKGVHFKCTEQNIETATPTGRLMMQVLSAIAEFETALRRERQTEGIASALANGTKFGKRHALSTEQVAELRREKAAGFLTVNQLGEKYGIKRTAVYDYCNKERIKNE